MSASTAVLLSWIYAAVMSPSEGGIVLVFTGTSLRGCSSRYLRRDGLYEYATNTDLSRFNSFLLVGLIGIVMASVVGKKAAISSIYS